MLGYYQSPADLGEGKYPTCIWSRLPRGRGKQPAAASSGTPSHFRREGEETRSTLVRFTHQKRTERLRPHQGTGKHCPSSIAHTPLPQACLQQSFHRGIMSNDRGKQQGRRQAVNHSWNQMWQDAGVIRYGIGNHDMTKC